MGRNVSNVFADALTEWHSNSCSLVPRLTLVG